MFSQKSKLIRSVASDGLTNIYKRWVSLNIIQKERKWIWWKNMFQDWKWKWRSNLIKSKIDRDFNSEKMHFRTKFGDFILNGWWVMVRTSSEWGKTWFSSSIWLWRSRSIIPKNYRDLNQGVSHLWSKFGDPSLNERWVIVRTNSWSHTHTDTQTYRRSRWQYPKAKTGLG